MSYLMYLDQKRILSVTNKTHFNHVDISTFDRNEQ
jgi:hypothetical protein